MEESRQAVFDAALALPDADRLVLIEQLLESLPTEAAEWTDDDLQTELDCRSAEVDKGTAGLVPWSEVKKMK